MAPAAETPFSSLIGTEVWFVPPRTVRNTRIRAVRPGPKGPLVSLDGIDTIDSAAGLTGTQMLALTADLPPEWTDIDHTTDTLDGFFVTDTVHGDLGEVLETIITGANDVLVVSGVLGEVLIPVIDDVIISVNEEARTITVTLLEGLLPNQGT